MQDASTGVKSMLLALCGSYKMYVCARATGYMCMYVELGWFLKIIDLGLVVEGSHYTVETKKVILVHQGSPQQ